MPSLPDLVFVVSSVSEGIVGGIIQYISDLKRGLIAEGVQVISVTLPKQLNILESRGLPRLLGAPLHVAFVVYALLRLIRLRKRYRRVIVHGHGASYALMASALARALGFPAVHTFHSALTQRSIPLRTLAPRTDALVFVSEALCRDIFATTGTTNLRIRFIPGAVDTRIFRPVEPRDKDILRAQFLRKYGLVDRGHLLLFLGRIVPEKGVLEMVEALGLLKQADVRVSALIVGPVVGSTEESSYYSILQHRVRALGLDDTVGLVKTITSPEKEAILAAADVFVCSSYREGSPLAVVEAMAAGLPVVASDVGGLRDQVLDGQTGYLVQPGDASQIARAITRLIHSTDLRSGFSAAARNHVIRNFGLETFIRRHLNLYSEILVEER